MSNDAMKIEHPREVKTLHSVSLVFTHRTSVTNEMVLKNPFKQALIINIHLTLIHLYYLVDAQLILLLGFCLSLQFNCFFWSADQNESVSEKKK